MNKCDGAVILYYAGNFPSEIAAYGGEQCNTASKISILADIYICNTHGEILASPRFCYILNLARVGYGICALFVS